jgi:ketosteroid isomerase-like protein
MESEIEEWLRAFAQAVRERDYATGRSLFAPDVVAFGTVAERAEGIDALVARQWRVVWETTRGFEFDAGSLRGERHGDRAWIAATWSSVAETEGRRRTGRATLVLARDDRGWRALHTHFSLTPTGAV